MRYAKNIGHLLYKQRAGWPFDVFFREQLNARHTNTSQNMKLILVTLLMAVLATQTINAAEEQQLDLEVQFNPIQEIICVGVSCNRSIYKQRPYCYYNQNLLCKNSAFWTTCNARSAITLPGLPACVATSICWINRVKRACVFPCSRCETLARAPTMFCALETSWRCSMTFASG